MQKAVQTGTSFIINTANSSGPAEISKVADLLKKATALENYKLTIGGRGNDTAFTT